ncbi:MAG: uracil-DNA glycosylase [Candidatus Levybacteria bacterium]|nr:uracil-DNA glycosylase [Candidatus Levybacteria bacterium]MSU25675.1 uracil-DNA glycosylase [Candidatus Levybacteria bacterium]
MIKKLALEKVNDEIYACMICPIGKTGVAVVGEGSANARVVFIGEAPGKKEAISGRPFIGRSGQLLRFLIRSIGLSEEEVYITSPVKYLPLRGTPTKKDIDHGREHLQRQLSVINPKIITLLGNVAAYGVLQEKVAVRKDHGKIIEKDGKKYFITLHPAAGLRFPSLKKLLLEDFKKINSLL